MAQRYSYFDLRGGVWGLKLTSAVLCHITFSFYLKPRNSKYI